MSLFRSESPVLGALAIEPLNPSADAFDIKDSKTKTAYFSLTGAGAVSKVNGLAAVNNGVAVEQATLVKSDQTATLAATDLISSTAATSALYKISWGLNTHTAGASGTATVVIGYTDKNTNATATALSAANSLATANVVYGSSVVVNAKAATAITIAVTYSTAGAYDLYAVAEAL